MWSRYEKLRFNFLKGKPFLLSAQLLTRHPEKRFSLTYMVCERSAQCFLFLVLLNMFLSWKRLKSQLIVHCLRLILLRAGYRLRARPLGGAVGSTLPNTRNLDHTFRKTPRGTGPLQDRESSITRRVFFRQKQMSPPLCSLELYLLWHLLQK